MGFPGGSVVRNLPANRRIVCWQLSVDCLLPIHLQEIRVWSLGWEDPWRRKWQPTPVFLPGKSHGHGSLVGYSPWDCKRIWHNLVTKQQQSVHMSIPISQFIPSTLTPLESMFVLYICFSNLFSTSVFEISVFQISSSEDTLLFK